MATSSQAQLLFSSDFGQNVSLSAPYNFDSVEAWQSLSGTDTGTGFAWPIDLWGATFSGLQVMTDTATTASTLGNYITNQIQTVTGPNGAPTTALYQDVLKSDAGAGGSTQDPLIVQGMTSDPTDAYVSEWIKLQPDLAQQMGNNDWRALFEFKTGGQGANYGGDYRLVSGFKTDASGHFYWETKADNNANGGLAPQTFWTIDNSNVPVPAGQWFHYEVYWHRSSGSDGLIEIAVNGQVIAEHAGPNIGVDGDPINRIMLAQDYSGGSTPAYQWVTDLQIYDQFPPGAFSAANPDPSEGGAAQAPSPSGTTRDDDTADRPR